MKNFKKVLSFMITFLFIFSLIPTNFITPVLAAESLKSPVINADGSVTFNYQGDGTEAKVIVKGSWDSNWAPTSMTKGNNNIWSATLKLDKGTYEYGICSWNPKTADQANGDWKADPLNSVKKGGNGNPLLILGPTLNKDGSVTFYYIGTGKETKVIVKGSWTQNWDQVAMAKDPIAPNVWSKTLKLDPGSYEYGICSWSPTTTDKTNGDWQSDPLNLNRASDGNPLIKVTTHFKSTIINSDGSVTFRYQGTSSTKAVYLAGDMNGWDPKATAMTKDSSNVWSVTVAKAKIAPGKHEYKFVVDGDWKADPANPNQTSGGNSLVDVPAVFSSTTINSDGSVTFKYKGTSSTKAAYLAGDMNGWSATATAMTKDSSNIWSVTVAKAKLNPGKHEYKFVVDGSWIADPANTNQSSGGNSIVNVPGFYAIKVPGQVQQKTTQQVTALSLNADGSDTAISGVTWSVLPSDAASINASGVLTANALSNGKDSKDITITGRYNGVTVTQGLTIVSQLTEQPGGKTVVLVGDVQSALGANAWDPANAKTRMLYQGNGLYKLTGTVAAGNYQYKVAIGGSWSENYGANATRDGGNIALTVSKSGPVTFYYSDVTHIIVDTTTYTVAAPKLTGTDVPANTTLIDYGLTGVYSTKVTLTKGLHKDLVITDGSKKVQVDPITITDASKAVTFSYDAATGIVFNDLTSGQMDTTSILFDSKDTKYKSVYGAVPTDSKVTFSLQAKKNDLQKAKLVLYTPDGVKVLDMAKKGTFDYDKTGKYDKWTVDYTPTKLGQYQFYFVVMNGSNVKAYGDDDGYYGTGKIGDLGMVGKYDMNVYDKNFKTPDWMKNAVVYQIFPDRFFDGDKTNDYLQKLSRGNLPYEYISNWYSIPEDPMVEFDKDGKVSSTYTANKGDGQWSNDLYGGDLKGIQDKLDYLKSLGVNTLYLNPIGSSSSNHRYDTADYTSVDPSLGNMDDYVNLIKEAHKRGMHLILDGVFNHTSDDSIYFDRYGKYVQKGKPIGAYQYWSRVYDLMNANKGMTQQQAETKVQATLKAQGITDFHYKDWFIIKNVKVKATNTTDANLYGAEHYDYAGWNGNESLPEIQALNNSEYNVSSWAKDVIDGPNAISKYWLNLGTDGWRLDAADSVSDDTWKHLRPVVKAKSKDDVIVGEIWGDSSKYLLGDMFDSVMNYRFKGAVQAFTSGSSDGAQATKDLEKIREQYPKESFEALMNIMGSHDVERIISDFDGYSNNKDVAKAPSTSALAKMKLVPFLQMTYPGAPTIYYGDELGMPGAADPDNRRAMPWGKGNKELVEWYAKLTNIRNAYAVLRTGDIAPITVTGDTAKDVMAYTRYDSTNKAVVVANRSTKALSGLVLDVSSIPDNTVLTNALNGTEKYTVKNGKVTVNVPAQLGIILVAKYTDVKVNYSGLKDAYDPSYIVKDRTVPATDTAIVANINSAKTGSNVQVSNIYELVSNQVLDTAKAKKVVPVIVRGDTSFALADSKVIAAVHTAALKGLTLSVGNVLTNAAEVSKVTSANSAKSLKALNIGTNLPGGNFSSKVKTTSSVGTGYKGKTVYVYYYNAGTKKAELIASPVVDGSGNVLFDITHSGDYFVTDKKLK